MAACTTTIVFLLFASSVVAHTQDQKRNPALSLSSKQECLDQCRQASPGYSCVVGIYGDLPTAVECCTGNLALTYLSCISKCDSLVPELEIYRTACSLVGLGSTSDLSLSPEGFAAGCSRAATLCDSFYPGRADCSRAMFAYKNCLDQMTAQGCVADTVVANTIETLSRQIATCPVSTPVVMATMPPMSSSIGAPPAETSSSNAYLSEATPFVPTPPPLDFASLVTVPAPEVVSAVAAASAALDIDPICDIRAQTCRDDEVQGGWHCVSLENDTFASNESAEDCCARKLPEFRTCLATTGLADCSAATGVVSGIYQTIHRLRSCQILHYSTGATGQIGPLPGACQGAAEMCGKFFSHGHDCASSLTQDLQRGLTIPAFQQISCCDDSIISYAKCIHIVQQAPECANDPVLAQQAFLAKTSFEAVCHEEMPMMPMMPTMSTMPMMPTMSTMPTMPTDVSSASQIPASMTAA